MNILAIAQNTFRETFRDRVLQVIIALSLLVILISKAIGAVSAGQDLKVIADLSLGAIDFFGIVLCVFVGTGLIYKEVDKKTLYMVLARPIPRWQFIVGKYLGMCMTLAVCILIMGIVFCLFFALMGGEINWNMLAAVVLLLFGLLLLNSIAIFFSSLSSPTVSAISTVAVFLVGRGTYNLKFLAELYQHTKGVYYIIWGVYYILPNFNNFNIKWQAVNNMAIDGKTFVWAIGYCFFYSTIMLYLACLLFNKRNF